MLPRKFRERALQSVHNFGHLGQCRTYSALRQRFFWYKMRQDSDRWVRTCDDCQKNKKPQHRGKAVLQSYVVGAPMERLACDICGPLPVTASGSQYILVVGDYFTKWIEAYPIENQEAITVAEVLVRQWISRFGVPKFLHSDQGTNFESAVFQGVCKLLGIEKTRTTPLHPASDGMIERFNQSLMSLLKALVAKDQRDWDLYVSLATMFYRCTVHKSTGETPNMMLFGRELVQPVDLFFHYLTEEESQNAPNFVINLQNRLSVLHEEARKSLLESSLVAKQYYDSRANHGRFTRGDLVLLYDPARKQGRSNKMRAVWHGPYSVIDKLSNVVYRIGRNANKRSWKVVHFDRLKRYHPREPVDNNWVNRLGNTTSSAVEVDPDAFSDLSSEDEVSQDPVPLVSPLPVIPVVPATPTVPAIPVPAVPVIPVTPTAISTPTQLPKRARRRPDRFKDYELDS